MERRLEFKIVIGMIRRKIAEKIKHEDKQYLLELIRTHGKKKNGKSVMSFAELINYVYLERNYAFTHTQFTTILELCGELEKEGMLMMVF